MLEVKISCFTELRMVSIVSNDNIISVSYLAGEFLIPVYHTQFFNSIRNPFRYNSLRELSMELENFDLHVFTENAESCY